MLKVDARITPSTIYARDTVYEPCKAVSLYFGVLDSLACYSCEICPAKSGGSGLDVRCKDQEAAKKCCDANIN